MDAGGTSVKVAVRIRPLGNEDSFEDAQLCINTVPGVAQIIAGTDTYFTFDHVFGVDSTQSLIYDECVGELLNAAFEGFNATILAYGQTGSGKTWTMGSGSSDMRLGGDSFGIIPRVIQSLFDIILQKEEDDPNSSYKVHVQFLELYGEDIKDLLEHTKASKVTIRETASGDVFVSGAREETVCSASQMMRALEDGSRHRTTASTLMNSSSSRSHAIFTIFLEHTIESTALLSSSSVADSDEVSLPGNKSDEDFETGSVANFERSVSQSKEVRKCKFHFVDLAGSERAKRTGAQGVQMKEGIDINKGLLALGNVISALGDDSRKGKVHVPYRVSKLTRMLQDSLGGNSKTLMICCVSPSEINFHESLNALRYANRARNIKNKPRVNRDPTLLLVIELKSLVQTLVMELIEVRRNGGPVPDNVLSILELEKLLKNNFDFKSKPVTPTSTRHSSVRYSGVGLTLKLDDDHSSSRMSGGRQSARLSFNTVSNMPSALPTPTKDSSFAAASAKREHAREVNFLKNKAAESEAEVMRLIEKLRSTRSTVTEQSERIVLVESERDFYRIKWSDSCPEEALTLSEMEAAGSLYGAVEDAPEHSIAGEMNRVTQLSAKYLREIQALRKELAVQKQLVSSGAAASPYDMVDSVLESDLSTNVARVIAQTERHLVLEARRLKGIGMNANGESSVMNMLSSLDDAYDSEGSSDLAGASSIGGSSCEMPSSSRVPESKIEENDLSFQRRQKHMVEEVAELGESIELKEQLLGQLKRSHYQYGVMKAFYEKKLSDLNFEMVMKQEERERLLEELIDLEKLARMSQLEDLGKTQAKTKEKMLRDQLEKRDEELRMMKKRQDELNGLSKVQARYMTQVAKLESDISKMRNQKVELTRSLQDEKKKHFTLLNEKAREIDKLKRDLLKTSGEAKRLAIDKLKAEERTKEAVRIATLLKKKVSDSQRSSITSADTSRLKAKAPRRHSAAGIKILNESELKLKKWLDSKINDINAREEAVATLRRHLEQQMSLINTREILESERVALKAQHQNSPGSKGKFSHVEEEALQEVEDRLESVEGQLKLRDRNIMEIESKLGSEGEAACVHEKSLDALKKMAAVTLPASHDLISLLFGMLVSTTLSAKQRKIALLREEVKEIQLRTELEEASKRIHMLARAHDLELTRSANEYEEKLLSLFTHSTIGQIVTRESGISPEASVELISVASNNGSEDSAFEISRQASFSTQGISLRGMSNSFIEHDTSRKVLLAAATEQCGLLKGRLEREGSRNRELQVKIADLSNRNLLLEDELKEKCVNIKFFEDESNLFRDMANKLRAGVLTLGGNVGGVILDQVKGGRKLSSKVPSHTPPDKAEARRSSWEISDDDDMDDDENVRGEFNHLADVISRTGSLSGNGKTTGIHSESGSPVVTAHKSLSRPVSGNYTASRDVVYERLTNPSNYTGAMKSAFGQDLVKKRQLVQMMKNGQMYNYSGYAAPKMDSVINRSESGTSKESGSRKLYQSSGKTNPSTPRDSSLDRPAAASPVSPSEHSLSSTISSENSPPGGSSPVDASRNRRISLPKEGKRVNSVPALQDLLPLVFSKGTQQSRHLRPASGRLKTPIGQSPPSNKGDSDDVDNSELPPDMKLMMDDVVNKMRRSNGAQWTNSGPGDDQDHRVHSIADEDRQAESEDNRTSRDSHSPSLRTDSDSAFDAGHKVSRGERQALLQRSREQLADVASIVSHT